MDKVMEYPLEMDLEEGLLSFFRHGGRLQVGIVKPPGGEKNAVHVTLNAGQVEELKKYLDAR